MTHEASSARQFAKGYALALALLAVWAWAVEIALVHSSREHLLPAMLLAFASLPSSLSLDCVYIRWPDIFTRPFTQLAWITVCAALQALSAYSLVVLAERAAKKLRGE